MPDELFSDLSLYFKDVDRDIMSYSDSLNYSVSYTHYTTNGNSLINDDTYDDTIIPVPTPGTIDFNVYTDMHGSADITIYAEDQTA